MNIFIHIMAVVVLASVALLIVEVLAIGGACMTRVGRRGLSHVKDCMVTYAIRGGTVPKMAWYYLIGALVASPLEVYVVYLHYGVGIELYATLVSCSAASVLVIGYISTLIYFRLTRHPMSR